MLVNGFELQSNIDGKIIGLAIVVVTLYFSSISSNNLGSYALVVIIRLLPYKVGINNVKIPACQWLPLKPNQISWDENADFLIEMKLMYSQLLTLYLCNFISFHFILNCSYTCVSWCGFICESGLIELSNKLDPRTI